MSFQTYVNIHKLPMYYTTKANPSRISKVKVIHATYSDHNAINLEGNHESLAKQPTKSRTTWEFLNTILINFLDKKRNCRGRDKQIRNGRQ